MLKRTERKFTQDGLAKSIGLLQSRLSEIENGKSPTWDEIEKIAISLKVPVHELLPANTAQILNCNSHDASQQYNGNISIQIPLSTITSLIKELVKEELKK